MGCKDGCWDDGAEAEGSVRSEDAEARIASNASTGGEAAVTAVHLHGSDRTRGAASSPCASRPLDAVGLCAHQAKDAGAVEAAVEAGSGAGRNCAVRCSKPSPWLRSRSRLGSWKKLHGLVQQALTLEAEDKAGSSGKLVQGMQAHVVPPGPMVPQAHSVPPGNVV